MPLIFSYGSNLHLKQMLQRCSSARPRAIAAAFDRRLAFAGFSKRWQGAVATLVTSHGKFAAGVIYQISESDLRVLDLIEGAPAHYRRVPCRVWSESGQPWDVQTYQLSKSFGAPSREYLRTIRLGYFYWGLDVRWIRNALKFSKRRILSATEERAQHLEKLKALDTREIKPPKLLSKPVQLECFNV